MPTRTRPGRADSLCSARPPCGWLREIETPLDSVRQSVFTIYNLLDNPARQLRPSSLWSVSVRFVAIDIGNEWHGESKRTTGVYSTPMYDILEEAGLEVSYLGAQFRRLRTRLRAPVAI